VRGKNTKLGEGGKSTELGEGEKALSYVRWKGTKLYEKHALLGLNPIYYRVSKCTTCHHYTNIIKTAFTLSKNKLGCFLAVYCFQSGLFSRVKQDSYPYYGY